MSPFEPADRASFPSPGRGLAASDVPWSFEGVSTVLTPMVPGGGGRSPDRSIIKASARPRVAFGTHLCAAGVPLRTAQAAMRHSKPELTANIYTDPRLLDVAGAIGGRLPPGVIAGRWTPAEWRVGFPRSRFRR